MGKTYTKERGKFNFGKVGNRVILHKISSQQPRLERERDKGEGKRGSCVGIVNRKGVSFHTLLGITAESSLLEKAQGGKIASNTWVVAFGDL